MLAAHPFEVTNAGGAPLGKVNFVVNGRDASDFSMQGDLPCFQPLPPGSTCRIVVTFAPEMSGRRPRGLWIADD